jgi:2-polyprenyl-6-methoxyphenol hydroxylase-like FAD-dependent oxidoreductase
MNESTGRTATVAGGGIGGLATALALQRSGWQVRVHERSASLDRGGAGLVLWPNALRCLAVLGVADVVRERSAPLAGSTIRGAAGRRLASIALGPGATEQPVGIVRADLVDALAAALAPGVVRFGEEVTHPMSTDADLLVGADGLRSVLRRSLGDAVEPEYRGYTVWRALIGGSSKSLGGGQELCETWGAGMRFGMVPAGPTATYVYAAASAPCGERADDELPGLRQRFGSWHEPIPALLAAMASVPVLRHDIYDLPPGRTRLHRGPAVLVGDAAHAMEPNLGQGAGVALEDAVVLAGVLAAEPSVSGALSAYAALREPRVAALARQSRQVGRLARLSHPGAVALRDRALLLTPDRLVRRSTRAAADWQPPLSAAADLQECR